MKTTHQYCTQDFATKFVNVYLASPPPPPKSWCIVKWQHFVSLNVFARIFLASPDRLRGSSSLPYDGNRVSFPGVKRPGRGVDKPPTTPSSAKVKERIKLYLYSPSGPLWPVIGWNVPLLLPAYKREQSPSIQSEICRCWPSWFGPLKNRRGRQSLTHLCLLCVVLWPYATKTRSYMWQMEYFCTKGVFVERSLWALDDENRRRGLLT
jgi:hypothetical protein